MARDKNTRKEYKRETGEPALEMIKDVIYGTPKYTFWLEDKVISLESKLLNSYSREQVEELLKRQRANCLCVYEEKTKQGYRASIAVAIYEAPSPLNKEDK